LLVQEYKFLHDRVQQAAYALIDESQSSCSSQIGRNLLEKLHQSDYQLDCLKSWIISIRELSLSPQLERTEIARLNLMVGQKAKAATAYGSS